MIDLLNYKEPSSLIIYLIYILLIKIFIDSYKNKEHFIFMPWNISTRYYPSYDIRGDPRINYPVFYLTPYNYSANGNYNTNI